MFGINAAHLPGNDSHPFYVSIVDCPRRKESEVGIEGLRSELHELADDLARAHNHPDLIVTSNYLAGVMETAVSECETQCRFNGNDHVDGCNRCSAAFSELRPASGYSDVRLVGVNWVSCDYCQFSGGLREALGNRIGVAQMHAVDQQEGLRASVFLVLAFDGCGEMLASARSELPHYICSSDKMQHHLSRTQY